MGKFLLLYSDREEDFDKIELLPGARLIYVYGELLDADMDLPRADLMKRIFEPAVAVLLHHVRDWRKRGLA